MKSIWYRDINSRVYTTSRSAPTERGYWVEKPVVSETSRSWVLSNGLKVPKTTVFPTISFAANEQQVNDAVWFEENLQNIIREVQMLGFGVERYENINKLRKIAEAMGIEQ